MNVFIVIYQLIRLHGVIAMTPEARQRLRKQLLQHEAYRQFPYKDTTGHLTIGIGRNLDAKGISLDEALILLDNDIAETEKELVRAYPHYAKLDDIRKIALLNMGFNLGVPALMQFRNMLDAILHADYKRAAEDALQSKWAEQVGHRAHDIAYMIETGL